MYTFFKGRKLESKIRIGLLVDYLESEYSESLIKGVSTFCKTKGISLYIFFVGEIKNVDTTFNYQYVASASFVTQNNLDGVVIASGGQFHSFTKEEFDESIKDKNTFLLVAKEDTNIIGFLLASIVEKEGRHTKFKKSLHINTLGTKKDSQNKGIGTALINEIKKIAKENKCDNINLSVWSFNENAIKFYKHAGFKNQKINMEIVL